MSFLNPECDILVGHGQKVSIILAKDYKPFEQSPSDEVNFEEAKGLIPLQKAIVTNKTFERLMKREEELKAELLMRGKKEK